MPSSVLSQTHKGTSNADRWNFSSVQLPPLQFPGLRILANPSAPNSDPCIPSSARPLCSISLHCSLEIASRQKASASRMESGGSTGVPGTKDCFEVQICPFIARALPGTPPVLPSLKGHGEMVSVVQYLKRIAEYNSFSSCL